jgi:mono/diheme cytochrome c family protein
MQHRVALALVCVSVIVLTACGGGSPEDEEAIRAQARADSLALAEELYDATVFDSLTWQSPQARLERGAVVYRASCSKCHGANGGGNGDYAMQYQLQVPSFIAPNWQYAGDVDGLRHRVFVGHEGVMPNWGLVGLKYRDVDAVAVYLSQAMQPARTSDAGSGSD